jgi:DNA-binding transcriptional MerR regulator
MAKLNISQAAKAAGVARVTIQRHIKKGTLSCEVNGLGQRLVDTSELIRVYGELQDPDAPDTVQQGGEKRQREAGQMIGMLQQKIEMLEASIEELKKDKEESTKREQDLREILKIQSRQLTEPTRRFGFFGRLFGAKNANSIRL